MKTDFSKLHQLKDSLQKKILKKAVRAGCKQVIAAVRSSAPQDSGALRQSISSKVDAVKGTTHVYGVVGPRSKWTKKVGGSVKKPSRYAHFIEEGRFRRPFLVPAWQSSGKSALDTMQQVIASGIDEVLS